jgi:hypothetical protein
MKAVVYKEPFKVAVEDVSSMRSSESLLQSVVQI